MLVDKQNELMSDLLFTVHQHGGDDVNVKTTYSEGEKERNASAHQGEN